MKLCLVHWLNVPHVTHDRSENILERLREEDQSYSSCCRKFLFQISPWWMHVHEDYMVYVPQVLRHRFSNTSLLRCGRGVGVGGGVGGLAGSGTVICNLYFQVLNWIRFITLNYLQWIKERGVGGYWACRSPTWLQLILTSLTDGHIQYLVDARWRHLLYVSYLHTCSCSCCCRPYMIASVRARWNMGTWFEVLKCI